MVLEPAPTSYFGKLAVWIPRAFRFEEQALLGLLPLPLWLLPPTGFGTQSLTSYSQVIPDFLKKRERHPASQSPVQRSKSDLTAPTSTSVRLCVFSLLLFSRDTEPSVSERVASLAGLPWYLNEGCGSALPL